MATLTIRNLPDEVRDQLRVRAARMGAAWRRRRGRSLRRA
ncbi:MAG: FitA-like ribbon-helix-helix domain-containing protein [Microvirga sp.]